jgi:propionyl-CoA synthetase
MRRDVHRADRVPRDQEGRPAGKLFAQYDSPNSARCSWPASAPTRPTIEWAEQLLKVPVIDHWWQTETGWAIAGNPMGSACCR